MQLEPRKQAEIEHSDRRRQIVTGNEYLSDSDKADEARIANPEQFDEHFFNIKFYSVTRSSFEYRDAILSKNCPGKICLDYCCGNGEAALKMAQLGAKEAQGIDISSVAVENAQKLADEAGVGDRTRYSVRDAEATGFADNTFDVIHVYGALHHLDLTKALPELARILNPGGVVVCTEALRHNPAIHLYRRLTPTVRTEWEVEHILGVPEIKSARQWFDEVDIRFFHLAAIGAVPFRKTPLFRPLLWLLECVDAILMRIPGVRWMAWQSVFTLKKPKSN